MPELVVTLGRQIIARHPLAARPLRLGSGSDVDVRLDPRSVDPVHAEIGWIDGVVRIRDLSVRNGVIVNGVTIEEIAAVTSGDVVNVGLYRLVIEGLAVPGHEIGQLEWVLDSQAIQEFFLRDGMSIGIGSDGNVAVGGNVEGQPLAVVSSADGARLRVTCVDGAGALSFKGQMVTSALLASGESIEIGAQRLRFRSGGGRAVNWGRGIWMTIGVGCVLWLAMQTGAQPGIGASRSLAKVWDLAVAGEHVQARELLDQVARSSDLVTGDRRTIARLDAWMDRNENIDRGIAWLESHEPDSALLALRLARKRAPEDPRVAQLLRRALSEARPQLAAGSGEAPAAVEVPPNPPPPLADSKDARPIPPFRVEISPPTPLLPGGSQVIELRSFGGDVVTLRWSVDRGEVTGAGMRVEYVAPVDPGTDWISVEGRHRDGREALDMVPVTVSPWPLEGEEPIPQAARIAFWKGYRLATDARSRDSSAATKALQEAVTILDDPAHPYSRRAVALIQSLEQGQ